MLVQGNTILLGMTRLQQNDKGLVMSDPTHMNMSAMVGEM